MSDEDLKQLDQVYAGARAEDIFLVEPATGLAAAGRLALLRQLEAEIGRPVPAVEWQQWGPFECMQLGMVPGSGDTRVKACRDAIERLKADEERQAARAGQQQNANEDAAVAALASWEDTTAGATDPRLIWWSRLDGRYQVEVQRSGERSAMLVIFDHANQGALVHQEITELLYGARFGPDVQDVERWRERAVHVIDGLMKR